MAEGRQQCTGLSTKTLTMVSAILDVDLMVGSVTASCFSHVLHCLTFPESLEHFCLFWRPHLVTFPAVLRIRGILGMWGYTYLTLLQLCSFVVQVMRLVHTFSFM